MNSTTVTAAVYGFTCLPHSQPGKTNGGGLVTMRATTGTMRVLGSPRYWSVFFCRSKEYVAPLVMVSGRFYSRVKRQATPTRRSRK